jgi:hypothetical protein
MVKSSLLATPPQSGVPSINPTLSQKEPVLHWSYYTLDINFTIRYHSLVPGIVMWTECMIIRMNIYVCLNLRIALLFCSEKWSEMTAVCGSWTQISMLWNLTCGGLERLIYDSRVEAIKRHLHVSIPTKIGYKNNSSSHICFAPSVYTNRGVIPSVTWPFSSDSEYSRFWAILVVDIVNFSRRSGFTTCEFETGAVSK